MVKPVGTVLNAAESVALAACELLFPVSSPHAAVANTAAVISARRYVLVIDILQCR
jgi:hypothetical protein